MNYLNRILLSVGLTVLLVPLNTPRLFGAQGLQTLSAQGLQTSPNQTRTHVRLSMEVVEDTKSPIISRGPTASLGDVFMPYTIWRDLSSDVASQAAYPSPKPQQTSSHSITLLAAVSASTEELYQRQCMSCHGNTVGASEGASSSLIGGALTSTECSRCTSVADLATYISGAMPLGNTSACTDTCAIELANYILSDFSGYDNLQIDSSEPVPGAEFSCNTKIVDDLSNNVIRRLTKQDYIRTIRDITGVDVTALANQIPDAPPVVRSFNNNAVEISSSRDHINVFSDITEQMSPQLEPWLRDQLACDEYGEACETQVISSLALELYRGPIHESESAALRNIFDTGRAEGFDFSETASFVLQSMLQAPRFLYRIEQEIGDGEVQPLQSYELASRLSYSIWGSAPDKQLLDAAAQGQDQVVSQIDRLLDDERAAEYAVEFLSDWFDLHRMTNVNVAGDSLDSEFSIQAELFDSESPASPFETRTEGDRTVVVWQDGGGGALEASDSAEGQLYYPMVARETSVSLFATVDLPSATEDSFYYKLEGNDNDWTAQNNVRTVGFEEIQVANWTNLVVGQQYMLKIQRREAGAKIDSFRAEGAVFEAALSQESFANFDEDLLADMTEETQTTFRHILRNDLPITSIYNIQETRVSEALARHYGFDSPQSGVTRYDLSSIEERGGLLTQGAMHNVGGNESSTVRRGLFMLNQVLCSKMAPPPDDVDTTPPDNEPGKSIRDISAERVDSSACGGCHSQFEPLVWGLVPFDVVGNFNLQDEHSNPLPQDGFVVLPGGEGRRDYSTIGELSDILAQSQRTRDCAILKSFEFIMARAPTTSDACMLQSARDTVANNGGTYRDIIKALVSTTKFSHIMTERN